MSWTHEAATVLPCKPSISPKKCHPQQPSGSSPVSFNSESPVLSCMLHTSPQCPKPSAANTLSAAHPAACRPAATPAACIPCTSRAACWPDGLSAAAVTLYAWLAGAPASQPAALYAAVEPRGVWASLLYTNAPRVPSSTRAMRPSDDSWHDWPKLPDPAATVCEQLSECQVLGLDSGWSLPQTTLTAAVWTGRVQYYITTILQAPFSCIIQQDDYLWPHSTVATQHDLGDPALSLVKRTLRQGQLHGRKGLAITPPGEHCSTTTRSCCCQCVCFTG